MADLAVELARLWGTHRPEIDARLASIELAVGPSDDGTLDETSRATAAHAAHQLAGTAGTFGFPEASERASGVELHLTEPHDEDAVLAPLVAELRTALAMSAHITDRSRQ